WRLISSDGERVSRLSFVSFWGCLSGQKWQSRKRYGLSMNATGRGYEPAQELPFMPPTKGGGVESIACGARMAPSGGCQFMGADSTGSWQAHWNLYGLLVR